MKRCWEIEVLPGQHLKFDWLYPNLVDEKTCKKDSVVLKDSHQSQTMISFCGNKLPESFFTPGNTAVVEFKSDKRNVGTGFKLRYQAVLGKNGKTSLTNTYKNAVVICSLQLVILKCALLFTFSHTDSLINFCF